MSVFKARMMQWDFRACPQLVPHLSSCDITKCGEGFSKVPLHSSMGFPIPMEQNCLLESSLCPNNIRVTCHLTCFALSITSVFYTPFIAGYILIWDPAEEKFRSRNGICNRKYSNIRKSLENKGHQLGNVGYTFLDLQSHTEKF